MGVEIDARVLEYAFGKIEAKKQTPPPIQKVEPIHGQAKNLIVVLREIHSQTKLVTQVSSLGEIGLKMLGLWKSGNLVQLTFHDTNNELIQSYTCLVPAKSEPSKTEIGELFGVTIVGHEVGALRIWFAANLTNLGYM